GVAGHSSGGFGAMVCSMLRPDVFSAFASHAGDALFEHCYLRDFAQVARLLRDHFDGSYEVFFERMGEAEAFEWSRYGTALSNYAIAAAYSSGEVPYSSASSELSAGVWVRSS